MTSSQLTAHCSCCIDSDWHSNAICLASANNKALTINCAAEWGWEQCSFYLFNDQCSCPYRRLDGGRRLGSHARGSFSTEKLPPSVARRKRRVVSWFCAKIGSETRLSDLQTISRRRNRKRAGNVCVGRNKEREFDYIWWAVWEGWRAKFVFVHKKNEAGVSLGCCWPSQAFSHGTLAVPMLTLWAVTTCWGVCVWLCLPRGQTGDLRTRKRQIWIFFSATQLS